MPAFRTERSKSQRERVPQAKPVETTGEGDRIADTAPNETESSPANARHHLHLPNLRSHHSRYRPKRNLGGRAGWFVFGALLFIVALPVVIFTTPGLPQAPPGMRAVKCQRCNAVQNIAATQTTYECWQCKLVTNVGLPAAAEDVRTWLNGTEEQPDAPPKHPSGKSTRVKCPGCRHVQPVPISQQNFTCEECGKKLKRRTQVKDDAWRSRY